MTRTRFTSASRSRRGFTLIELLVVISIIAVLASLIAPAVQSARRAARKIECMNNMRQVSLAVQNFASSTGNGNMPWLVTSMANSSGSSSFLANWVVQILPAMENSALLKSLKANSGVIVGTNDISVSGLTCPDDVDSHKVNGGLSYVANIGHINSSLWTSATSYTVDSVPALAASPTAAQLSTFWTSGTFHSIRNIDGGDLLTAIGDDTDEGINAASGVFVRDFRYATSTLQPSLDYISTGDGTTQTIMLSENLNAGTWYATSANQIGFGVRVVTASNSRQNTDFSVATTSLNPGQYFGSATSPGNSDFLINRNLGATASTSPPRPSSNHVGGVNVMMCDGSGRFLPEAIDAGVYGKLITSNGVQYSETVLNQGSY